jgi:hypothetical protein
MAAHPPSIKDCRGPAWASDTVSPHTPPHAPRRASASGVVGEFQAGAEHGIDDRSLQAVQHSKIARRSGANRRRFRDALLLAQHPESVRNLSSQRRVPPLEEWACRVFIGDGLCGEHHLDLHDAGTASPPPTSSSTVPMTRRRPQRLAASSPLKGATPESCRAQQRGLHPDPSGARGSDSTVVPPPRVPPLT